MTFLYSLQLTENQFISVRKTDITFHYFRRLFCGDCFRSVGGSPYDSLAVRKERTERLGFFYNLPEIISAESYLRVIEHADSHSLYAHCIIESPGNTVRELYGYAVIIFFNRRGRFRKNFFSEFSCRFVRRVQTGEHVFTVALFGRNDLACVYDSRHLVGKIVEYRSPFFVKSITFSQLAVRVIFIRDFLIPFVYRAENVAEVFVFRCVVIFGNKTEVIKEILCRGGFVADTGITFYREKKVAEHCHLVFGEFFRIIYFKHTGEHGIPHVRIQSEFIVTFVINVNGQEETLLLCGRKICEIFHERYHRKRDFRLGSIVNDFEIRIPKRGEFRIVQRAADKVVIAVTAYRNESEQIVERSGNGFSFAVGKDIVELQCVIQFRIKVVFGFQRVLFRVHRLS